MCSCAWAVALHCIALHADVERAGLACCHLEIRVWVAAPEVCKVLGGLRLSRALFLFLLQGCLQKEQQRARHIHYQSYASCTCLRKSRDSQDAVKSDAHQPRRGLDPLVAASRTLPDPRTALTCYPFSCFAQRLPPRESTRYARAVLCLPRAPS